MDTGTIYIATNLLNGKQYVGQTIDFKQRLLWHLHNSKYHFGRAIRKYGKDSFTFEQLEYPAEELNQQEKYWIAQLNTFSPGGYNHTTGGDCFKMSEATKEKISKNNARVWKGRKRSQEFRDHCSRGHLGIPLTEEHKANLCGRIPWNKGKETPEEVRIKQSIAASKRKASPETLASLSRAHSGEKNGFYGKKHSAETLEKIRKAKEENPLRDEINKRISATLTGRPLSEETKRKMKIALDLRYALPEDTKKAILDEYLAGSFIYTIAKKYSMVKKRISKIIHNQIVSQEGEIS